MQVCVYVYTHIYSILYQAQKSARKHAARPGAEFSLSSLIFDCAMNIQRSINLGRGYWFLNSYSVLAQNEKSYKLIIKIQSKMFNE